MAAFEGTTSGRTARVCGQMAATTMASTLGTTIGPPADSAYAVEPVGVATTIPSAEYCPTSSPSTDTRRDRKSTRLNSSHSQISYAVFCLKKKKKTKKTSTTTTIKNNRTDRYKD